MTMEQKKNNSLPSIQSMSRLIEETFCGKIYREDSQRRRECLKFMEAKRKKKIGKEELLTKLGLTDEVFTRMLDEAVEETESKL